MPVVLQKVYKAYKAFIKPFEASQVSFWCLYCKYFTPCSTVSIVNFEHVNADWDELYKALQLLQQFRDEASIQSPF